MPWRRAVGLAWVGVGLYLAGVTSGQRGSAVAEAGIVGPAL